MKVILRAVIAAWLLQLGALGFAQNFGWTQATGLANDIGISATGAVWIVGSDKVAGGYGIPG